MGVDVGGGVGAFVDGRQVSPSTWNCLLGGGGRRGREEQVEEQQGIGQKEASQNLQCFFLISLVKQCLILFVNLW